MAPPPSVEPAQLVSDALNMAIQQRQPAPGLIVHSHWGSQYASALYRDMLTEHGFVCRTSRKGNCWDNAVAERYFFHLRMDRCIATDCAKPYPVHKNRILIEDPSGVFLSAVRINNGRRSQAG